MKFQLFSDIHLEFYKTFPKIERKAKNLILAGDIGRLCDKNYKDFMEYCSKLWDNIIVVLGNHEYYHNYKTYEELLQSYILYFSQFTNIHLLEKDKITINGFEIIGLTMWTNIAPEYENILNCVNKIKQKKIGVNNEKRTIAIGYKKLHKLHIESKKWLLENYNPNKNTIIITHHPLTHKNISQPIYENEPTKRKEAFATNMDIENKSRLICISGHTHFSHDFIENNIRYISNQMGYKEEIIKNTTLFDENKVFEV
jgi:predicted phosphodiesterase